MLSLPLVVLQCLLIGLIRSQENPACNIGKGFPLGVLSDPDVDEASGLAVGRLQPNVLWTHNDHGDSPARIFALGNDGLKRLEVELKGVGNEDYEDIAVAKVLGVDYIYIADTGNNDHDRDPLHVLRFLEPIIYNGDSHMTIQREDIEDLEVRYPGFSYDCEALMVDPETYDIIFFTKDRKESISEVYRYPYPQSETLNPFTLEHVGTLPLFWITGGDISPSGEFLAVTNKQEAFGLTKPSGSTWTEFLSTSPQTCTLDLEVEEQRESIAVSDTGYWTTSECEECPIWFYPR